MNWLERLDVIVLILMFAYIVVVVARVFYRCHLARRMTRVGTSSQTFKLSRRKLAADLTIEAGSLKSIATAAPFLGLVGMCVGVLSAFRGVGMEKHAATLMFISYIAAAPITTAAGIFVAVPATWSYNYLCTRIDWILSEVPPEQSGRYFPYARRFPLSKRLSGLPFAVVATPVLAIVVVAFTAFSSSHTSKGLPVRLVKIGMPDTEHFPVKPIVIAITGRSRDGAPAVYVNSKKIASDELENSLRGKIQGGSESVAYLRAENGASWGDVVNVIDEVERLHVNIVLLSTAPAVGCGAGALARLLEAPHSRR